MSEESEETGTPVESLEEIMDKFQEHVVKNINEAAAKGEGMKSLTDKEIADYLRDEAPCLVGSEMCIRDSTIYRGEDIPSAEERRRPYQRLRYHSTTTTV